MNERGAIAELLLIEFTKQPSNPIQAQELLINEHKITQVNLLHQTASIKDTTNDTQGGSVNSIEIKAKVKTRPHIKTKNISAAYMRVDGTCEVVGLLHSPLLLSQVTETGQKYTDLLATSITLAGTTPFPTQVISQEQFAILSNRAQ